MVLLTILAKFLILLAVCEAMTMKQIRSTGKMMRKTCMPKSNVEEGLNSIERRKNHAQPRSGTYPLQEEKVDKLSEGVFIEEKEVMCYMACIMKMANTFKNGKLNYDAAMKQADLLLPDEIKEPAKAAITACRKVPDAYKDPCEAAFHATKCIFNENPDIFYFP